VSGRRPVDGSHDPTFAFELDRSPPALVLRPSHLVGCRRLQQRADWPVVTGPPADSVVVNPDTLIVKVGETKSFSAVGYDSSGAVLGSFAATWSSSDTFHVVITQSGASVTGRTEGFTTVYLRSGSAIDSAVVAVKPAQRGWFVQDAPANGAHLNDVFFQSNGRDGWVVGAAGKILVTDDGGAHWELQVSHTSPI
jgi:uncharacterized protein YjdB